MPGAHYGSYRTCECDICEAQRLFEFAPFKKPLPANIDLVIDTVLLLLVDLSKKGHEIDEHFLYRLVSDEAQNKKIKRLAKNRALEKL